MCFDPSLLNEVLPRAESLVSGAGDDRYTEAGLAVKPVEEAVCFPLGGVWEGVHGFRAIDRY